MQKYLPREDVQSATRNRVLGLLGEIVKQKEQLSKARPKQIV